jgi:hypothetical protein
MSNNKSNLVKTASAIAVTVFTLTLTYAAEKTPAQSNQETSDLKSARLQYSVMKSDLETAAEKYSRSRTALGVAESKAKSDYDAAIDAAEARRDKDGDAAQAENAAHIQDLKKYNVWFHTSRQNDRNLAKFQAHSNAIESQRKYVTRRYEQSCKVAEAVKERILNDIQYSSLTNDSEYYAAQIKLAAANVQLKIAECASQDSNSRSIAFDSGTDDVLTAAPAKASAIAAAVESTVSKDKPFVDVKVKLTSALVELNSACESLAKVLNRSTVVARTNPSVETVKTSVRMQQLEVKLTAARLMLDGAMRKLSDTEVYSMN